MTAGMFLLRYIRLDLPEKNALKAYREILSDEYNWGQIFDRTEMADPAHFDYCIADLSDEMPPVLFIRGGGSSAAEGTTRVVFYDNETGQCRQVWGPGNCIYVTAYIPKDEDHPYPLIFCSGGRQDVCYEYIYEVRDNDMFLIAQKYDIYPYGTDRIGPYENTNDKFYLSDTPVNITAYFSFRGRLIDGYTPIEWESNDPSRNPNHNPVPDDDSIFSGVEAEDG